LVSEVRKEGELELELELKWELRLRLELEQELDLELKLKLKLELVSEWKRERVWEMRLEVHQKECGCKKLRGLIPVMEKAVQSSLKSGDNARNPSKIDFTTVTFSGGFVTI
jgi:hypothetical protein